VLEHRKTKAESHDSLSNTRVGYFRDIRAIAYIWRLARFAEFRISMKDWNLESIGLNSLKIAVETKKPLGVGGAG